MHQNQNVFFMKGNVVFLILIFLPAGLFGQDVKKVCLTHKGLPCKEVFFVLKENPEIKHGMYKKLILGRVCVKGSYDSGKKTGIWEYFGPENELVHKYDYDKRELVYDSNRKTNINTPLRKPVPLGGYPLFCQAITQILEIPESMDNDSNVKIYLKCFVDKEGVFHSTGIVNEISDVWSKETLKSINQIDMDWLPACNDAGEPINMELTIPISFKI